MADATEPRPDLPPLGVLEYDGYAFTHTKTLGVNIVPEENSSGTGVNYNRFTFKFETHLAGGPTGEPVTELRRLLTKPGKAFRYEDRGLGRFSVNVAGSGAKDVRWGPKCKEVGFEPLGGGNACKLTWTLEVAIVDCDDAVHEFALMEHEEQVSYQIDEFGYSTRTVTGHILIPQNRIGDGTRLKDNPDAYREKVVPPLLTGFRRTFAPFVINEARTRLDYGWTDKQMGPNIPPKGVVDIDATEELASSVGGLASWVATISATYTLAADCPDPQIALVHFIRILCGSRIKAIAKTIGSLSPSITPILFRMSDPGMGFKTPIRPMFSMQFTYNRDLAKAIGSTGLWEPVPSSSWQYWATSLQNSAFHPRGVAKLRLNVGEERLTSLCKTSTTKATTGGAIEIRGKPPKMTDMTAKELIDAIAPKPDEQTSWLYYTNDLEFEADNGVVSIRTLPTSTLTGRQDVFGSVADALSRPVDALTGAAQQFLETVGQAGGAIGGAFGGGPPPGPGRGQGRLENDMGGDVTRRVAPTQVVYLVGKAARSGFPIPRPNLDDVGGVKPVPANRLDRGEGFTQRVMYGAGTSPIYLARWRLRYSLPTPPKRPVAVPPNPVLDPSSSS